MSDDELRLSRQRLARLRRRVAHRRRRYRLMMRNIQQHAHRRRPRRPGRYAPRRP